MKWVTRQLIRINRAATVWLIRRFIGPEAIFLWSLEASLPSSDPHGGHG